MIMCEWPTPICVAWNVVSPQASVRTCVLLPQCLSAVGTEPPGQGARRTSGSAWGGGVAADLKGESRPAGLGAMAASSGLGRTAATTALRQHQHEGSEGIGCALYWRSGGPEHDQHHARGDAARIRRTWCGRWCDATR